MSVYRVLASDLSPIPTESDDSDSDQETTVTSSESTRAVVNSKREKLFGFLDSLDSRTARVNNQEDADTNNNNIVPAKPSDASVSSGETEPSCPLIDDFASRAELIANNLRAIEEEKRNRRSVAGHSSSPDHSSDSSSTTMQPSSKGTRASIRAKRKMLSTNQRNGEFWFNLCRPAYLSFVTCSKRRRE